MFSNSIPVLMYHHVMPVNSPLSVTPEVFERQMRSLKDKKWKTLDSNEFLYLLENPKESRKKCVLITFDDGFVDNYVFAYPILKKYKMKATLFVATDFITDLDIKRNNFKILPHKEMWKIAFSEMKHEVMCTWNELMELENENIFDIQSHGHSHRIPDFIEMGDYVSIEMDLKLSKELLIKHLGKESIHLAWPKGIYDHKSIEIAKKLGFQALYTTQRGANFNNPFFIKRIAIKNKDTGWLIKKLAIYSSSLLCNLYHRIRIR